MTIEKQKLPAGWQWVKLEDVANIVNGFAFPENLQGVKNSKYPFVKVSDMNYSEGIYVQTSANYIDDDTLGFLHAKSYPAGTIIFPKVGGALLTNKKRIMGVAGLFDNNIMGVIPRESINNIWLFYYFLTIDLAMLANTQALPSIKKSVTVHRNKG
jgi:type I restriction enzyme S subunit